MALIGAIYSRIALFSALNHILFLANEEATLKIKQGIRFPGLFKVTNQIAGKWKTKSIIWRILQLLFVIFSAPKINEFNFKPAQYCIDKIFELTKSCIWAISNGCKKVVIEPRVVQFLSEVILVISNRTRAAHSFNRAILAQIALHSVQLALFILLCIGFS